MLGDFFNIFLFITESTMNMESKFDETITSLSKFLENKYIKLLSPCHLRSNVDNLIFHQNLDSEAYQEYFDKFTAQLSDGFDEFATNLLDDECLVDNFLGDIEMTDDGTCDISKLDILTMPIFINEAPMTPPHDTTWVDGHDNFEFSPQAPIEVGANVTVMANIREPLKFMWSPDEHSSLLSPARSISPFSTLLTSEETEIVVDDEGRDDDPDYSPEFNNIDDDSNDNSCASSEYTEKVNIFFHKYHNEKSVLITI